MLGGRAVAEVLYGEVNPSGRLPITIPRSVGHVEQFYSHKPSAYFRGYTDSVNDPLYRFGHGLSYTSFDYDSLVVPSRVRMGDSVSFSVRVTNTGDRPGTETILAFVRDDLSSVTTPVRKPAAFGRVSLDAGEAQTVELQVESDLLSLWDQRMRQCIEPGFFTLFVAGLTASFEVIREE
jgi:beta-glucosidase